MESRIGGLPALFLNILKESFVVTLVSVATGAGLSSCVSPRNEAPGGEKLGAYHGAELAYVFDTPEPWMPWRPLDEKLTETIQAYWVNFARTGDPNSNGLPHWPAYSSDLRSYLLLGDEIRAGQGRHQQACELFLRERARTSR